LNPYAVPTIKQYNSGSYWTFQEKTIPGGCQKKRQLCGTLLCAQTL